LSPEPATTEDRRGPSVRGAEIPRPPTPRPLADPRAGAGSMSPPDRASSTEASLMRGWRALSTLAVVAAALLYAARGRARAQAPEAAPAPGPAMEAAAARAMAHAPGAFEYFPFLHNPQYVAMERIALWVVLLIAVAGLLYAGMLVGQVLGADQGT